LNQDYLGDPLAFQAAHEFLAQLAAPQGVYAVNGTVDDGSQMQALTAGTAVQWLDDAVQRVKVGTSEIYIIGVSNAGYPRDRQALEGLLGQTPPEAYSLLLYHTPDLIETAAAGGVDLYLAGHTHGGQIRLPFYGAIITFSRYGKDYEMGRYTVGPTTLYVTRGVGMEGLLLPRVRVLCPPEIEIITLE
jgi:hypothetical protein